MTLNSRPALQTALAHRSIRRFTAEPVSDEMLSAVLEAARASSTSSYLQNGSIIRVTDIAVRKELRAVCAAEGGAGHAYVEHCAEFLVFCIDAARHHALDDAVQTDWTEVLLIGAIDAGIMAQNMVLTAESLGLGAVYIGSIRNDIAPAIPTKTRCNARACRWKRWYRKTATVRRQKPFWKTTTKPSKPTTANAAAKIWIGRNKCATPWAGRYAPSCWTICANRALPNAKRNCSLKGCHCKRRIPQVFGLESAVSPSAIIGFTS